MIRPTAKRFLINSDGAAAIEFALIAPIALIVLLGLADVGLWVREQAKVNQVMREVVQATMITRDTDKLRNFLAESLTRHDITAIQKSVTCSCPGQEPKPKCEDLNPTACSTSSTPWPLFIEIHLIAQYQTIFPLWGLYELSFDPPAPESRMQVQVR